MILISQFTNEIGCIEEEEIQVADTLTRLGSNTNCQFDTNLFWPAQEDHPNLECLLQIPNFKFEKKLYADYI